jgi:hypothetical protein
MSKQEITITSIAWVIEIEEYGEKGVLKGVDCAVVLGAGEEIVLIRDSSNKNCSEGRVECQGEPQYLFVALRPFRPTLPIPSMGKFHLTGPWQGCLETSSGADCAIQLSAASLVQVLDVLRQAIEQNSSRVKPSCEQVRKLN